MPGVGGRRRRLVAEPRGEIHVHRLLRYAPRHRRLPAQGGHQALSLLHQSHLRSQSQNRGGAGGARGQLVPYPGSRRCCDGGACARRGSRETSEAAREARDGPGAVRWMGSVRDMVCWWDGSRGTCPLRRDVGWRVRRRDLRRREDGLGGVCGGESGGGLGGREGWADGV